MHSYKTIVIASFTILACIFIYQTANAQLSGVALGDKVKINAPSFDDRSIIGWVEEKSDLGILISSGNKRTMVPYNTIQEIMIRNGQKSRWGLGAVLGIIPGAIGGALFTEKRCNPEVDPCFLDFTDFENALRVTTGMLIGMTLGSMIGASIKTDRWQKVPFEVSMGLSPYNPEDYSLKPVITLKWSLGSKK